MSLAVLLALAFQGNTPIGIEALHRLDLMPQYRNSKPAAVTSYDRTEGNDDGFSGKYSFVRKEGDTLVLADLKGPGCIMRIHTPTPTDEPLEFYFDGATTPQLVLPYRKLFTGEVKPFMHPMVDYAGGGYYSYVPIPYAKSCKVVLRAPRTQFYDINYTTYPAGTEVKTFDPKAAAAADLSKAIAVFSGGKDSDLTAFNVPSGTKLKKQTFETSLTSGKSVTLFETKKPGRIASFRLGPAESFVTKARDIYLKVTWDGAKTPSILMPVGDFFGYAWGQPAMGSALVGTSNGTNYCNFPMPFDKSAKIELVSLRTGGSPVPIRGEIIVGDTGRKPDEGRFYAVWKRENPTTEGQPFTWLDAKGRGHIVGLSVQSQGIEPGNTFFFEGDDKTIVDGEMVVHGTGSEDFFNGGWYDVPGRWDGQFARSLSGCMAYQRYMGRTGAYRFFLGDAYSFESSIVQTIEHAPEKNQHPADYAGVTYLYCDNTPTDNSQIPSAAVRTVVDPPKLIFTPHWTMPIEAFSFAGTTLTRGNVQVNGQWTRALTLRAKGVGDFDLCFVMLRCDVPASGKYKVTMDAIKGPDAGIVQLFREEVALGQPIDLYAEKQTIATGIEIGEFDAKEGANGLMFKVIGKNEKAAAWGLDLINVICARSK